jgi:hypothetical protein
MRFRWQQAANQFLGKTDGRDKLCATIQVRVFETCGFDSQPFRPGSPQRHVSEAFLPTTDTRATSVAN